MYIYLTKLCTNKFQKTFSTYFSKTIFCSIFQADLSTNVEMILAYFNIIKTI